MENDRVFLTGHVVEEFVYNHASRDKRFYKGMISVIRDSGTKDIIPVIISEKLLEKGKKYEGMHIALSGEYRARNIHREGKTKLDLFVFVKEIKEDVGIMNENRIELRGYICKEGSFRITSLGRKICDFILAVNDRYGRSYYIPCIAWGKYAKKVAALQVGKEISITGRIQSREYKKRLSEGGYEVRVAYEVSSGSIEL